jgi:hypothetical protein
MATREVRGNRHDCLFARLNFRQLRYASMPQIVKADRESASLNARR